jgi:hypothetical protein
LDQNYLESEKHSNIILSSERFHPNIQILKNSDFDTSEFWNLIVKGDNSDVDGNINQGTANYYILGDKRELTIDEPLNNSDWTPFRHPYLSILPDTYNITSAGAEVYHFWHENVNQTRNRPSVQWKRNVTMPLNMSDYIITSASLEAIFNASVTVSPHNLGGIDREGDVGLDDYSSGDYADFYVLLSNFDDTFEPIQVAFNRTSDLGRDTPAVSNYTDTPFNNIPEDVLISVLTSALENDNFNFIITLGIDIYCEDNEIGVDQDLWNSLIIRSFNLTFTYEKKIDQFTSGEWTQLTNEITGSKVQITDASFNFDYKSNETWNSALSSNSEFRIIINNNQLEEDTIKLSFVTTSFQKAKVGGYDITNFIRPYENISISIQVFLADEFLLDHDINITIDNAILIVSYKEFFPDFISEPILFWILLIFASIAAVLIGGYLVAYQKILKYPKPVRKVRKYRKTLRSSKDPRKSIIERKTSIDIVYKKEIGKSSKFLKEKNLKQKQISDKIAKKKIN